ncbi:hypothetical protein [Deinococcus cellulosilyticus]|uniref:Uncharacterized protein n=1 Tax=Deinococcus cellulosilyticus (strain DSM 18568 / NBRC 106333 / KACC 11606 / 5516J-15) TaxID=1223518 RepID=A0A511MWJ2_DEIC1|nr:hypothetical protein [Deinococcus cellulosilyticus]GEM44942.1 hypothetical protein DC3_05770 [Deinococcus cellulosilyticus NBRC 106333 = KACC 11606]
MLRIEFNITQRPFYIPGTSRYPVTLSLHFHQGDRLLVSVERLNLECVYDLRNWLISDFFYQKHFLMTDEHHRLPFVVGLLYAPQERGWRLMAHQHDQDYRVLEGHFSEVEVRDGLNAFFEDLRVALIAFGVHL